MAPLDGSLRAFLDEVGGSERTRAGGSVAALVTACAAALIAKIARASTDWAEGAAVAAQGESLRDRAERLVDTVAEGYEAALRAREENSEESGPRRDFALGQAYARAAEPPLELARVAADVAQLAAFVAESGDPAYHADAAAASLLAAGAAEAAAELVAVNLTASAGDARVREARKQAEEAARAATPARAARE
jgi:formiminotetrahydrofolate cyclodeaminase